MLQTSMLDKKAKHWPWT